MKFVISLKNKRTQCGSATVEASVVIPLLITVFVSLLSVVRVVSVYGRIQHALNQVASELSQYSYIYEVSGLKQMDDEFDSKSGIALEEFLSQAEVLGNFYEAIQKVSGESALFGKEEAYRAENLVNIISEINNLHNSATDLAENISRVMENPVNELKLIGFVISDLMLDRAKNVILGAVTKRMLVNRLSAELKLDSEKLGKALLIKGGIENLDFTSSVFLEDGQTIDVILEYTVKPGFLIIPEIKLRNRVCMFSWMQGVGWDNADVLADENISLWNYDKDKNLTVQHMARGSKIEKLFASELKKKLGEHAEITPESFKTIDLIEYAHDGKEGSLVMIFSLNPFLPTYRNKSAVTGIIKQNLNKLSTFRRYQAGDCIIDVSLLSGNYKKVAYVIVPENKPLPEQYTRAFEECRKWASKMGIELYQVQKYGEYDYDEENI